VPMNRRRCGTLAPFLPRVSAAGTEMFLHRGGSGGSGATQTVRQSDRRPPPQRHAIQGWRVEQGRAMLSSRRRSNQEQGWRQ